MHAMYAISHALAQIAKPIGPALLDSDMKAIDVIARMASFIAG